MNIQGKIQREILPIPDIPYVGLTTDDVKDSDTTSTDADPHSGVQRRIP